MPGYVHRAVLAWSMIKGMGTGLYLAGSMVFFTRYVGLRPSYVGVGLSAALTTGLLAQVPCGMAADRFGGRIAWLAGSAAEAAAFFLYPLVRSFPAFAAVAIIEAVGMAQASAGKWRYLGDLFPDGSRAAGRGYLRSANNAGMALGTVLAGVPLAIGGRAAYLVVFLGIAAATTAGCGLVAWAVPRFPVRRQSRDERRRKGRSALRDPMFVAATVLSGVVSLNGPLLSVIFPLWLLKRTDAPPVLISASLLLNMVLVIAFQPAAGRSAEDLAGAGRAQRLAAAALAAASVAFAVSAVTRGAPTVAVLVTAVVVLTASEVFSDAAVSGIGYNLAPAERRGEYLSVISLGGSLSWAVAPAGLTALVIGAGPVGWAVAAGLFSGVGALTRPVLSRAEQARVNAPETVGSEGVA
ncbi:MAG: MFS transporter [Streptomyces sp.]|nr:MFS transporter [Streptomyces sp.]